MVAGRWCAVEGDEGMVVMATRGAELAWWCVVEADEGIVVTHRWLNGGRRWR
ncbi:hypothetical protein SESBI_14361 [Sesbania bispinosa]|nr:hypothetical protein SESBI_14361 [Sesbania bispinosa]